MDRRPHRTSASSLVFAVAADDHLARLFGGQTLAAGFRSPFFHGRAKADSFYGADFRKTGSADNEARFTGFFVGVFLLCHEHSISKFLVFARRGPSRLGGEYILY